MSQPKVTKGKTRQEKPKLKVMHAIDKNNDGTFTIASNAPKLKEAVAPKAAKTVEKAAKLKPNGETTDEQRSVLKALHDLGGKDLASMDIAKKLGFDKRFPNAPRAPVRNAMEKLHTLHLVSIKKTGIKYSYSITDKGTEALKDKPAKTEKDKAHDPAPASTASTASSGSQAAKVERPANTDIECPKCHTFNPFMAEFCKECGSLLRVLTILAAS